jgi:hypothetical protein
MCSGWCYDRGFVIVSCLNQQDSNNPLPEYAASFLCISPGAFFASTLGKNWSGIIDQEVLDAHRVHARQ